MSQAYCISWSDDYIESQGTFHVKKSQLYDKDRYSNILFLFT